MFRIDQKFVVDQGSFHHSCVNRGYFGWVDSLNDASGIEGGRDERDVISLETIDRGAVGAVNHSDVGE